MDDRQISAVADEIKEVDHVADVLAYSDVTGGSVPAELLPDGNVVTGQAAGSSFEFGLKLIEVLSGSETAQRIRKEIYL